MRLREPGLLRGAGVRERAGVVDESDVLAAAAVGAFEDYFGVCV